MGKTTKIKSREKAKNLNTVNHTQNLSNEGKKKNKVPTRNTKQRSENVEKPEFFEWEGSQFQFYGFTKAEKPKLSILITTFDRVDMLKRCISKIQRQTYQDYEIVVFDDCSNDETQNFLEEKSRKGELAYLRCVTNVAKSKGDRFLINLFLKRFCRGKFFVYLCDDDYWILKDLLKEQMALMDAIPGGVAMVIGSQVSCTITDPEDNGPDINDENFDEFFAPDNSSVDHRLYVFQDLFPKFMVSNDFIQINANNPLHCNINTGATIFSKEIFDRAQAFKSEKASEWQAGYELRIGPAAFGYVFYINKPCLYVELRPENASFTKTQRAHYLDMLKSVREAFRFPLRFYFPKRKFWFLFWQKRMFILRISRSYLRQSLIIQREGSLALCSEENMQGRVTGFMAFCIFIKHWVPFRFSDLVLMVVETLPKNWIVAYEKLANSKTLIGKIMHRLIWGKPS